MKTVRVGTRDSALALKQAEIFISLAKSQGAPETFEIVPMKTKGDLNLDKPLYAIGGMGLFTAELDKALLSGEVDITVSSLKDLPAPLSEGLPIIWHSPRENPFDCIAIPKGRLEPDRDLPIGSSSARRILQLKALWPWARFEPIRGNVQTRLRKLDEGLFSATVLAAAGLERSGLMDRAWKTLSFEEMLPAAGQGIIAAQARPGFELASILASDCAQSRVAAQAERAFLEALGLGCSSAAAAYCRPLGGGGIILTAMAEEGGMPKYITLSGGMTEARDLGAKAAEALIGRKAAQ